jgi:tetratricopeptide (TPR) repeat protein/predicted Ser/Thr protein kinase
VSTRREFEARIGKAPSAVMTPGDPQDTDTDDVQVELVRAVLSQRLFGAVEARIGRFIVLRQLGAGGMGVVYAAYDPELDRKVAVKLVHASDRPHSEGRARMMREAQALAKLSHPNVVGVHEIGEYRDQIFVAMEFLEGMTLSAWWAAAPRRWREVLDVMRQAGRGLVAAHAVGLVHRDFKPENVMVGERPLGVDADRARVLDFGLARGGHATDLGTTLASGGAVSGDSLTNTGALVGTPAYMAPEQFASATVDEPADQFSFCVVLWEGLYGERPFRGSTLAELHQSVTHDKPRAPPPGAKVPAWLRATIERGLANAPGDRWPSMQALLDALDRDPTRSRRRLISVAGGLVGLGLAGLGVLRWQQERAERCSGASEALAEAWGDARRTEVQSAMLATNVPYAQRAWERAAADLDDYASVWTSMHEDACVATTIRGDQSPDVMDLRMACLARARVELHAVTQTLATADARMMPNAHLLTANLRDLTRCADVPALQASVEPPEPEDAPAVDEARVLLAAAKAEREAGRLAVARDAAARAAELLVGVDYVPVQIELAFQQGEVLETFGDYEAAETALRSALAQATAELDAEVMRRSAAKLLFIVGHRLRRADEAQHRYRDLVEALASGNPDAEAELAHNLAVIYIGSGAFDEAERYFERANAIAAAAFGPDHGKMAMGHAGLANVHYARGELEQAQQHFERALEIDERVLGPDHPGVAMHVNNIAYMHLTRDEYAEAQRGFERANAIWGAIAPDHPELALSLTGLATLHTQRGEWRESLPYYERALAIDEKALGPDHPDVAISVYNIANVHRELGDPVKAQQMHERALAIREKALGPDHLDTARSHAGLGQLLLQRGDFAAALQRFERAVAIFDAHAGEQETEASARFGLARALWAMDKGSARALEQARRAREGLAALGAGAEGVRDEVDAWLRSVEEAR